MPTGLAIDGTNLLYRSHHALSRSDLRHAGRPVWAVHGLLSSIARLTRTFKPDAVVVAFDSAGGCPARRQLQPAYKATRSAPEQDLAYQLDWAPRLLAVLGLGTWVLPGWEADDGVASAAAAFSAQGGQCVVVSSDRDVFQLSGSSVSVALPDGVVVSDDFTQAKYGVPVHQYVYLAALRGEPSDNLPGVPGVGVKTAAKLLRAFGTLEGVLDASDEQLRAVAGPRTTQALREHAATARLSFEVAQLRTDLPVDLQGAALSRLDPVVVDRVCRESGLPAAGAALAASLRAVS